MSSAPDPAPPTRSQEYYLEEGDVIVRVEDTLYRFHSYHLQRATTYFDKLLENTPPASWQSRGGGDVDEFLIVIDEVEATDFEALLWFFYESGYRWSCLVDKSFDEKWKSTLLLAEKFSMDEVAKVACYALHRASAALGDIYKIALCVRHGLSKEWIRGEMERVISRKECLSADEARQLGFEMTTVLADARETSARLIPKPCKDTKMCIPCATTFLDGISIPNYRCHLGVHMCAKDRMHACKCDSTEIDRQPIIDAIDITSIDQNHLTSGASLQSRCDAWGSAQGDLFLKVEDKVVQIHSYHLMTASSVFTDMLALPTTSTIAREGTWANPITLEGENLDAWKNLLWFFYDSPYAWSEEVKSDDIPKWECILALSEKYCMKGICQVAVYALDHHNALTSVRKIGLCVRHNIDGSWMAQARRAVSERAESLTAQEAEELGIPLAMALVKDREQYLRALMSKLKSRKIAKK
ncbi:hypothetical protein BD626DRAFT_627692 [Schizophyllum amplum]|uniref:BTB domain-containing protein n=1 Tax=Schizophyllum amplum TaxID=97359 RepID=A0A550CLH5_9AGAR|nr:hypothetical protein BD626DRAFT_627692 [Auriculariopsis ampla]